MPSEQKRTCQQLSIQIFRTALRNLHDIRSVNHHTHTQLPLKSVGSTHDNTVAPLRFSAGVARGSNLIGTNFDGLCMAHRLRVVMIQQQRDWHTIDQLHRLQIEHNRHTAAGDIGLTASVCQQVEFSDLRAAGSLDRFESCEPAKNRHGDW